MARTKKSDVQQTALELTAKAAPSIDAAKIEEITANCRLNSEGKVKISFNGGKSMVQMFESLQAQGLNFETSYNVLLNAVLHGKTKVSKEKVVGDKAVTWETLPLFTNSWACRDAAKKNIKKVGYAILGGEVLKSYAKTVSTSLESVNKTLQEKFNLQKHSDGKDAPKNDATPAPIEITIKAKNAADAIAQKAAIEATGGNYKINIVIECL